MKREVVVSSVAFGPDGIELSYMVVPDDVRSDARVVTTRSTSIAWAAPAGLGDAAVDLRTSVEALATLLDEALGADQLAIYEPPAEESLALQPRGDDDEDDDDVGMGDGR